MFERLKKILYNETSTSHSSNKTSSKNSQGNSSSEKDAKKISTNVKENTDYLNQLFHTSNDLMIREFKIGSNKPNNASLVFISGLVDSNKIDNFVLDPLFHIDRDIMTHDVFSYIKESVLTIGSLKESLSFNETVNAILSGSAALFLEGADKVFIISVQGFNTRNIAEPQTETVVRGPREGFVESISINMTLLRRKIKNPNLVFEELKLGEQTNTNICIAYIKGIANEKIVQEVKDRLSRIKTDSILESGYVEAFIEDAPQSFFPTMGYTEKPDVASGKMLEGRIAILTDGTPFVLTIPYLFVENFQTSEDYYLRPFFATYLRLLRLLGFFITTFLPGIYVAITSYHQELLPPDLLTSIAAAQEGTPFPIAVEALVMVTIFEILREAGIRMPKAVGSAVSIVGALVIGDAAVSAGLVGAPMVVVIAATAIASFIVPLLAEVMTLSRIIFILAAGIAGLYGMMLAFALLITHQSSLRSFGIPYFSSLTPLNLSDLKDVFMRAPLWAMKTRPSVMTENTVRQDSSQKPSPPNNDQGE